MLLYIRERRKLLGITQEELSSRIGVTQENISRWENGIIMPQSSKLPLIAEALDCSLNELFICPTSQGTGGAKTDSAGEPMKS